MTISHEATLELIATILPDTAAARGHVYWEIDGNDASPDNGDFGSSATVEVTIDESNILGNNNFVVKAGCDQDDNSSLGSSEVSHKLNFHFIEFDELKVFDKNNTSVSVTASETSSSGDLNVYENPLGDTVITLDPDIDNDTSAFRSHVLWTITGDTATDSSGTFETASPGVDVTLAPDAGNTAREFVIKAGTDDDNDGTLDADEKQYEVKVVVVKLELTNIKFNHDTGSSASDAINIRQDFTTPIDISNGEWVKGGVNHPIAYTADNSVTIKTRFIVQPDSITSADIWAVSTDSDGSLGDVVKTTVAFSGGVSVGDANGYIVLPISGNTPNVVMKTTTDAWQWKAENIDGTGSAACELNTSGAHTVYTILNEPTTPWVNTFGHNHNAWVNALDFAVVTCNAGGAANGDAVLTSVTTAQVIPWQGDVYYTSANGMHFRFTEYMNLTDSGNCLDSAQGLAVTTRLLGVNADAISRTYFFEYNHHCYVAYGLNAYDSCKQIQSSIADYHVSGISLSSTFVQYKNVYITDVLYGYDIVSGLPVVVPVQNRQWNPATLE